MAVNAGIFVYDHKEDKIIPSNNGELFDYSILLRYARNGYGIFRITLKDGRRNLTNEIALELIRDWDKMEDQAYHDCLSLDYSYS